MKEYPSIDAVVRDGTYYCYDKLDGSGVRGEWDPKKGFWKFGKRHGLIDGSNPHLQLAQDLIQRKYGEDLARIFRTERWRKVTAFFELWGPRSFAGNHEDGDDITVTLLDSAVDNRGLLAPRDFVRTFDRVDHAALLHRGPVGEVAEQVRVGTLPGMTFEGVVCKGAWASPGLPRMFKIKNQAWYEKLRQRCGGDEALFEAMK